MSLALAFCTAHGIVVAADRYLMTKMDESKETFCQTQNERKLFLSQDGYAFAYTGVAFIGGKPTSYWVDRFVTRFAKLNLSLPEFVKKICIAFHAINKENNVIIIGAGYFIDKPCVYSCNSTRLELIDHVKDQMASVVYAGESELAETIINAVVTEYSKFNIPDAIDYLQYIIRTASDMQRFGQMPMTVSRDCDVAVITQNGPRWILPPEFLG